MSLPEVMVALCVMSLGFMAVWTSSAQSLRLAQAHRETIAATETLMRRVEDCRASGWNTIVSAESIQANVLQTPAANAAYLSGLEEQITVTPYPAVSPAPTPIIVQRHSNGVVQIVSEPSAGLYLRSILAVRADLQVTWKSGQNARLRQRNYSTIISMEGLLR
jgi:Tfp pilus assembly protein PilV